MRKCRRAMIKENLIFQHEYCESPKSREKIFKIFNTTVEAYEELPPWYSTFNADGSDIRLKDDIIMFCVRDLTNCIEYYPVFPAVEGLRLLREWNMEIPPKMTVFAYNHSKEQTSLENASLRSLIAFVRLFMLHESKQHSKMAYGFNNLYKQLHDVAFCDVSAEVIRLVNTVLGEYITHTQTLHFGTCRSFQEFVAYIKKQYSLLEFKDSNFDRLREKLQMAYPDEKVYF